MLLCALPLSSCAEKKIGVFQTNQFRRSVSEIEINSNRIKANADECERDLEESREINEKMKSLKTSSGSAR